MHVPAGGTCGDHIELGIRSHPLPALPAFEDTGKEIGYAA